MKKSYTFDVENLSFIPNSFQVDKSKHNIIDNHLPGKHVIQNLINYSKSLNIIKLDSIGTFGLISN
jgi:hypothetical protein